MRASHEFAEFVLDLFIERTTLKQSDVTLALRAEFGISASYAQGVASGILLIFREEDWIKLVEDEERGIKVWTLIR